MYQNKRGGHYGKTKEGRFDEKQLEQEKWDEIKKIVCDSGKSIDEIRQMFQ